MSSLLFISLYLAVCLFTFGLTQSISDTHYRWVDRYDIWGYMIFPVVMLSWATLVILECHELAWSGIGIYYVGIFCMFKAPERHIGIVHYLGAAGGIAYLMFKVWLWCPWLVLSFVALSGFALFSREYRIYIIEVLAIIVLYLYLYCR